MQEEKDAYIAMLKDPRWISRRNEILARDKNTCQLCGCNDKYLHVHHRYYTEGLLPWEYGDDCLVTLCEDCHKTVHTPLPPSTTAKIGRIYTRYHSDFENTCVVYCINPTNGLVYTLEYDNGANTDDVYSECNTLEDFAQYYNLVDYEISEHTMFLGWWNHVCKNLDKMPMAFRYNFRVVLKENNELKKACSYE